MPLYCSGKRGKSRVDWWVQKYVPPPPPHARTIVKRTDNDGNNAAPSADTSGGTTPPPCPVSEHVTDPSHRRGNVPKMTVPSPAPPPPDY